MSLSDFNDKSCVLFHIVVNSCRDSLMLLCWIGCVNTFSNASMTRLLICNCWWWDQSLRIEWSYFNYKFYLFCARWLFLLFRIWSILFSAYSMPSTSFKIKCFIFPDNFTTSIEISMCILISGCMWIVEYLKKICLLYMVQRKWNIRKVELSQDIATIY